MYTEYINESIRSLAVPIASLTYDPNNTQIHDERQMRFLRQMLQKYGQTKVIVVWKRARDDLLIVAGNGTTKAMQQLGYTHVAANVREFDSYEQARAFAIGDNRSAQLGRADELAVARALMNLTDAGISPDVAGYTPSEASGLLSMLKIDSRTREREKPQPRAPDPPAEQAQTEWNVSADDMYRVGGRHLLLCADSTDSSAFARVCGDSRVRLVVTSPPYAEQRKHDYGGVRESEYVSWFSAISRNIASHLAPDGSFFLNIKPHTHNFQRSLYVMDLVLSLVREHDWLFIEQYVWTHQGTPMRPDRPRNAFEPIYHFAKDTHHYRNFKAVGRATDHVPITKKRDSSKQNYRATGSVLIDEAAHKPGIAMPLNVIHIPVGSHRKSLGSAAFPLGLPRFFIDSHSERDDFVLDPFSGTGTTMHAAHLSGRRALGIERLPKYVAVTLQRLSELGLEVEKL